MASRAGADGEEEECGNGENARMNSGEEVRDAAVMAEERDAFERDLKRPLRGFCNRKENPQSVQEDMLGKINL